jgi:NAD(P)-dependent dehydrogenase (short-subunit alcohol dehydrogenase family)
MSGKDLYEFKEKVAFVTGAAAGIGRATALAFAKNGARVAVVDVNEDAGGQTVHMIQDAGGDAFFIKCNVASSLEVKSAIEKTTAKYGRLDFAFNNAGIEGEKANTVDCTEENWQKVIDINLKSVWLCMKFEIPQMLKQGGGTIVNCSSIAGVVGFAGTPAYVASKHGVIGLTKTAALEFSKSNIRVNAICPGVIQTSMVDRYIHGEAQLRDQLALAEPIGRLGQPEEIANAALWLCSPQSSFVTGHPLVVDGGWVAQ